MISLKVNGDYKMKILTTLLCTFMTSLSFAASVTVPAFDIDFHLDKDAYQIDFELEMACRYEKFVISDSAQFEYTYKKVPLTIKFLETQNGLTRVRLENQSEQKHKLTGFFKSNKQCQTYMNFFLIDRKYATGWANQMDRPIRLGIFEHSRLQEEKTFDVQKLKNLIEEKKLSFNYKDVGSQINVKFAFDDIPSRSMSTYMGRSTARNPETQMPYPLQN